MAITRAPTGPDEDADEHQPQSQQPQPPQQQQPQSQPQQPHHPHALHQHSLSSASTATLDIESWTVHALESLSIAPIARGTGNALSIPLDGEHDTRGTPGNGTEAAAPAQMKLRGVTFGDATGASVTPPRRRPSRDSMRRREELHKGKEGSRQRRRWENAHLVHVPNVQPPLPTDWQIHPTHRVLPPVPYHLAHFWDKGPRELAEAPRRPHHNNPAGRVSEHAGHVPRDLRMAAKRIPAVKSFLRVLEEPVRQFVVERGLASTAAKGGGESSDETDPDDEEIVFVGRNGRMRDGKPWKSAQRQVAGGQTQERGLVLDAMDNDAGGAFKRWLTHSISDYYGLDSKSATVGSPARRVIYVGVKPKQAGPRREHPSRPVLPPPLWEMF